MKKTILILSLLIMNLAAGAQGWQMDWHSSVRLGVSTGQYMPFWARTGGDGLLPVTSGGLVTAGADVSYRASSGFFFEGGVNLAGAAAVKSQLYDNAVYGMVDRLYVSGGWKMLRLDVGMLPREKSLGDLSISGGDVMWSGNARNIPGINASTDWIYLEKGHWIGVKGNLAHYQLIDNRYVDRAMIHNKEIAVKIALGRNIDLIGGFAHWAQWGGNSPVYGDYPVSLKNFYRIFMAKNGGEGASVSDQVNVLGNHLGKEYFRLDWRTSAFTMTAQYDKMFEDNSGMQFKNAPDGVWSLKFSFSNRKALVTDVIYEHIRTTWQSGTDHDRPATEEEMKNQDPDDYYYGRVVIGGCDNYFSNGEYRSGWTNYGRTIGLPLILPNMPGEDGKCYGMASNRLRGHHIGIRGIMSGIPYTFKGTYTRNYGKYKQGNSSFFATAPWQLSLALELEIGERFNRLPVNLSTSIYGDIGQVYQNSAGLALKISY